LTNPDVIRCKNPNPIVAYNCETVDEVGWNDIPTIVSNDISAVIAISTSTQSFMINDVGYPPVF
jgi:hypothetical protein